MEQEQLFVETLAEALDEAVRQLGGPKKVGALLWPEKGVVEAGKHLQNCFNTEHSQKLSLDQVDFILDRARKANVHVVPQYIARQYLYDIHPIEPEDKKAELQRQYIAAVKQIRELSQALGDIEA